MFTLLPLIRKSGNSILQSSQHYLVMTALGHDRSGIVNQITHHVSSYGCNIEDSRLALFGKTFSFIMLLSGSAHAISRIESTLPLKGSELDLLIVMKRTSAIAKPSLPITVWIEVKVVDSPHIIERFTNLFTSPETNIAELVSKTYLEENSKITMLYIQMTAHMANSTHAADAEKHFHKLCHELSAKGIINIVNTLQGKEKNGELS